MSDTNDHYQRKDSIETPEEAAEKLTGLVDHVYPCISEEEEKEFEEIVQYLRSLEVVEKDREMSVISWSHKGPDAEGD